MTIITEARNASLNDLATLLKDQHARKVDVVAPATALRSRDGVIHVRGAEQQITLDGVTTVDGRYRPTASMDGDLATRLDVPIKYLRRVREQRPDLYDANVNGLIHGRTRTPVNGPTEVLAAADSRSFLFRGFRSDDGDVGVGRALLSDSYGIVDNLDVLTAVLDGVRASGVEVEVTGCDLTDRRMYVKVAAPSVAALAPELLRGYRSPYSGLTGEDNPTVFAGFIISNSEVGQGAFSITPRLTVEVCSNGMTMNRDVQRAVHTGSKLDEGIIRWSEDTQRKNLELVTAKARDAVATFLDVDYVRRSITALERQAGVELSNAAEAVKAVGTKLRYTEAQIDGVLDHFIRGGQLTAGGVLQAVTSFCQTIEDADTAYEFEATGVAAMEYAATLR